MEVSAISEAAEMLRDKNIRLSDEDKEFVLQFAFSTGDKELTEKLMEELAAQDADKEVIYTKYKTLTGFQPDWIRRIENLLIALEMYRMQEEKVVTTLTDILAAFGVEMSVEDVKKLPADAVKEQLIRSDTIQKEEEIVGLGVPR